MAAAVDVTRAALDGVRVDSVPNDDNEATANGERLEERAVVDASSRARNAI